MERGFCHGRGLLRGEANQAIGIYEALFVPEWIIFHDSGSHAQPEVGADFPGSWAENPGGGGMRFPIRDGGVHFAEDGFRLRRAEIGVGGGGEEVCGFEGVALAVEGHLVAAGPCAPN